MSHKVWQCEFCEEQVLVDLEPEEIPGTEDVTYLLSPAPSTSSMSMAGVDRSLVVFCVDTSGSMCVTSEVGIFLVSYEWKSMHEYYLVFLLFSNMSFYFLRVQYSIVQLYPFKI